MHDKYEQIEKRPYIAQKRPDTIVSNLCFQYGAGEGNRTLIISLEG